MHVQVSSMVKLVHLRCRHKRPREAGMNGINNQFGSANEVGNELAWILVSNGNAYCGPRDSRLKQCLRIHLGMTRQSGTKHNSIGLAKRDLVAESRLEA